MTATPFSGTLRGYQQVASDWQCTHPKGILADSYGLGKTPTTIATLSHHLPALVVTPGYLTNQWFDMLCDLLPRASISLLEGDHAKRQRDLYEYADVRVVNIEMLRSYNMPDTETLVIDEAHHIRGREARQSITARKLSWATPRVHFLTATPYYKSDEDIWHLLHCLAPKHFSSYWNFIREWFTVNWYAPYAPHIYGINRKKREAFNHMLSQYMLARDYQDVQRELPPLIENIITFDMPSVLLKEYQALKRKWQLMGEPVESVGAVYYILRQLTMCHKKIDCIRGIVDSVPNADETILIYTWYRDSAKTISEALQRPPTDTPTLLITGDTSPLERASLIAQQKRTHSPRIIVATIESLQEGVNLEHIHHVIYAEETYVRGKHNQTLARARRDRGDTQHSAQPVNAYYIRAKKTIDERIPIIRESRGTAGDRELARQLAAS